MTRKSGSDAVKVALMALSGSLLVPYLRSGEKLPIAWVVGTVVAAIGLGLAHLLFTKALDKAQAQGPDQSPLKWYFSPVLFIGVGFAVVFLWIA